MSYGAGKYTYELVDEWPKLPEGWAFLDAAGVVIDSTDNVYVLNRGGHPVIVFDRDGNLIASWGEGYFNRAHGATFGPDGSVWCADDGSHIITKFTPGGRLLQVLGARDQPSDTGYVQKQGIPSIKQGGPPFNRPTGVALSPAGEIYVSDGYGNARVHKFSPEGDLLLSWGEPGADPGQFKLVHSVWLDKEQRVWVCDRENNRIQIFDTHGKYLNQWTDLLHPTEIFIDNEGTVYISELSQRVSIFSNDGKLLARWGNPEKDPWKALFVAPHTISVDSRGDIYIGEVAMTIGKIDRGARVVQKFRRI